MNKKNNIKYTETHEWARKEGDDIITIGITEHATKLLGDVVYVDTEAISKNIIQNQEIATIESIKAAAGLYAPLSGIFVESNEQLATQPELINKNPMREGWILTIKPSNIIPEWDKLLTEEEYNKIINKQTT